MGYRLGLKIAGHKQEIINILVLEKIVVACGLVKLRDLRKTWLMAHSTTLLRRLCYWRQAL